MNEKEKRKGRKKEKERGGVGGADPGVEIETGQGIIEGKEVLVEIANILRGVVVEIEKGRNFVIYSHEGSFKTPAQF